MANVENPTRPLADDENLKPGRPKYGTVEPEYDEEIAGTKVRDKERNDTEADPSGDSSNETSGGRRPGKRKGTPGGDA